jgi:hypothetical protein
MPLHALQGDLLFVRQDTRPAVALIARPGTSIVAGEATGHAHRLTAGTIQGAPDDALSLDITQTGQVIHEEHGLFTLEPGFWLVVRKPEYSPQAIKAVLD